jgi:hypothetical protein
MADPVKFQFPANLRNNITANEAARADSYKASGTVDDVTQPPGTVAGNDQPQRTGSTLGLGDTRRFYAADGATEIETP